MASEESAGSYSPFHNQAALSSGAEHFALRTNLVCVGWQKDGWQKMEPGFFCRPCFCQMSGHVTPPSTLSEHGVRLLLTNFPCKRGDPWQQNGGSRMLSLQSHSVAFILLPSPNGRTQHSLLHTPTASKKVTPCSTLQHAGVPVLSTSRHAKV